MKLEIETTCPRDGTPLELVTAGRSNGWRTSTVLGCPRCHFEWAVHAELVQGGRAYYPKRVGVAS